jgi:DNA-binding transcriptional LysR family regulator
MELRQIRYFQALGRELHFARAAEKLFITQPALTKQIQQLESAMEVKLLERTKRSVQLTVAGEYFLEEVDYLLNHLERSVEGAQRRARGELDEIRIGFVGSAMQHVIPDLLVKLNQEAPRVHAALDELNNKSQIQAIQKDKLDIGFVRMESVPQGLDKHMVYEDSFSLVVSSQHPILKEGFDSLRQFKNDSFILFSNDYSQEYYDNIMGIFNDHQFRPKVSYRSVQANSIFRLVEKQLGVAIVPSALATGISLDLAFISLAYLRQRTRLYAVWSPENQNAALKQFLQLVSHE